MKRNRCHFDVQRLGSLIKVNIVNFLIYSNGLTVFHKSVNSSDVQHKDDEYLFKLIKKVVEEIGAEKVVQ